MSWKCYSFSPIHVVIIEADEVERPLSEWKTYTSSNNIRKINIWSLFEEKEEKSDTYFVAVVRGVGILEKDGRGMPERAGATTTGFSMTTVPLRSSAGAGAAVTLRGAVAALARGAINWGVFNLDAEP